MTHLTEEAEELLAYLQERADSPHWGLDHIEVGKVIPRLEEILKETYGKGLNAK